MRVVKIMDACDWIFEEPACCTLCGMVQLDLTQPRIRRGRLKSPFPNSGLWIHKGLLAASRRNECQIYTGWLFCWQKPWGPLVRKELKVMTHFF